VRLVSLPTQLRRRQTSLTICILQVHDHQIQLLMLAYKFRAATQKICTFASSAIAGTVQAVRLSKPSRSGAKVEHRGGRRFR
jgi:hypothetical protein